MDKLSEKKPLIDAQMRMRRIFLALEGVGFVLSLATHLSTFVTTGVPRLMPLYLIIATILLGVFSPTPKPSVIGVNQIRLLKLLTRNWSKQARMFLLVLGIYSLVTLVFAAFVLNLGGLPTMHNGEYVLWNHGTVIKQLTIQEFNWHVTFELRWTSTIPLFGYYATMMNTYFNSAHSE
jgi:hypothetical protein